MTDMMPDLSHLTEEERKIIEEVLQRQKAEENKEQQVQQKYEKELDEVESQINERKAIAMRLIGTQDDAICQICQKTKFADGIGHKCYYCQLRSCTRCGGRTQIKVKSDQAKTPAGAPSKAQPQKTIWACSLCQKRQQILGKTGKWFHKDGASGGISGGGSRATTPTGLSPTGTPTPTTQGPQPPSQSRSTSQQAMQPNGAPGIMASKQQPFTLQQPHPPSQQNQQQQMQQRPPSRGPGQPPTGPQTGQPPPVDDRQRQQSQRQRSPPPQQSERPYHEQRQDRESADQQRPSNHQQPSRSRQSSDRRSSGEVERQDSRRDYSRPVSPGPSGQQPPQRTSERRPSAQPPPSPTPYEDTAGQNGRRRASDVRDPRYPIDQNAPQPSTSSDRRRRSSRDRYHDPREYYDEPPPEAKLSIDRVRPTSPTPSRSDSVRSTGRPRSRSPPRDQSMTSTGNGSPSTSRRGHRPPNERTYEEEPQSPRFDRPRTPEFQNARRDERSRERDIEFDRDRKRSGDGRTRAAPGASDYPYDNGDRRSTSRHRDDAYEQRRTPPTQEPYNRKISGDRTSGRVSPSFRAEEYADERYEDQRRPPPAPSEKPHSRSRDSSRTTRTPEQRKHPSGMAEQYPTQPREEESYDQYSHRKLPTVTPVDEAVRSGRQHRPPQETRAHERRRLPEPEEVLRAGAAASAQPSITVASVGPTPAPRALRQSPHSRQRQLENAASNFRQDSLSSDAEVMHRVRVSPTNTHYQHHQKTHYTVTGVGKHSHSHRAQRLSHHKQRSFSSSDDELASTSECPSCEEVESETYSDRGSGNKFHTRYAAAVGAAGVEAVDVQLSSTGRQLSVTWQPSADGQRMIGHMILRRPTGASLGLKVVGGRPTPSGRLGAFVTKVKRGSVAEIVGHLKPGDEVLEWNGRELQNASFDEVCDIINESKHDPQVELIVSRPIANITSEYGIKGPSTKYLPTVAGGGVLTREHVNDMVNRTDTLSLQAGPMGGVVTVQPTSTAGTATYIPGQTPVVMITAPTLGTGEAQMVVVPQPGGAIRGTLPQRQAKGQIFGRIQIALVYSPADQQLVITVYQAMDLPPRNDGSPRNPYVKMFLLPDRSEKSRRQSKTLASTCQPTWQQSFIYQNVTQVDLATRVLEVTLWDYDKYATNEFLGEVLYDLATSLLDNEPRWYTLTDLDEESPVRLKLRHLRLSAYANQQAYSQMGPGNEILADPSGSFYAPSSYPGTGVLQAGTDPLGGDLNRSRPGGGSYRSDTRVAFLDQQLTDQAPGMSRSRTYYRPRHPEIVNQDELDDIYSGYYSDHGHRSRALRRLPRPGGGVGAKTPTESGEPYETGEGQSGVAENMTEGELIYDADGNVISGSRRHLPRVPADIYGEEAMRELGDKAQQIRSQGGSGRRHHSARTHRPSIQGGQNRRHAQRMYDPLSPPNDQNMPGYLSDGSETSMSITSTQSERPRTRTHSEFQNSLEAAPEETEPYDGQDGTMSDSAVGGGSGGASNKSVGFAADAKRKKSIMTRLIPGRAGSALTLAEQNKQRMGFSRSEEVGVPAYMASPPMRFAGARRPPLIEQGSTESQGSVSSESSLWLPIVPGDGPLGEFIAGLGPGQVVGRQALASPCLGEIQLMIGQKSGSLEVKVIRARNLVKKPGAKYNPAPYVKVYLMEGKYCVAKAKTSVAARTAEPRFDQHLVFQETHRARFLQASVWGDYGRMERKTFMGIALIKLEVLETTPRVEGWYKLYHSSSLVGTSSPARKESQPASNIDPSGQSTGGGQINTYANQNSTSALSRS